MKTHRTCGSLKLAGMLGVLVLAAGLSCCRQGDPRLAIFGPAVDTVCLSPNGKLLCSGGRNCKIVIWDVARRARITSIETKDQLVTDLVFSPDGRTLASATASNDTITFWDGTTFIKKASATVGADSVPEVAYSPDGGILGARLSKTVKLLDPATGTCIRALEGSHERVTSIAFSLDGRMLASGDLGAKVRLWDVKSGKNTAVLDGESWIASVAFIGDGQTLASGDAGGKITFWDVRTASKVATIDAHASHNTVNCLAFADGKLASGSDDGWIKVWDVRTRKELLAIHAHFHPVSSLFYQHDGKSLASGSLDGTAKLWDLTSGTEIAVFYHNEEPDTKAAKEVLKD